MANMQGSHGPDLDYDIEVDGGEFEEKIIFLNMKMLKMTT